MGGNYGNVDISAGKCAARNEDVTIVVQEKLRSSSISTTESAIEMLDTVINAEECSTSSTIPEMELTQEFCEEQSPEGSDILSKNLKHDYECFRQEVQDVIDEILDHARATVVEMEFLRLNSAQADENDNVFRNQTFLAHLSDLISKPNPQTASSQDRSKTLPSSKPRLKPSKSVPTFEMLLNLPDFNETSFSDDTNVEYTLNNDNEKVIPPPPVFQAELFEKVAALKRSQEVITIAQYEPQDEERRNSLESDKSVDKENFRDKLERLLSAPPNKLSPRAPTPLPRTSLIQSLSKRSDEDQEQQPKDSGQVHASGTISATMKKQRELFEEVLKKINKDNDVSRRKIAF